MTTSLNCSTRRRLQKLQQIPCVWEGDRRPLSSESQPGKGECILWVDGSQGMVRAMDVVGSDIGPEAVVRTLLRAMEHPSSPASPARPQKIVVRDREIQFFLRGVLQELEIVIDYVPHLPVIDEFYRGFQDVVDNYTPDLPPQYAPALRKKALEIWQAAPWEILEEHQILAIEISKSDFGTLYASVMGMLGMEYGILLYRSPESLKRFRAAVLTDDESPDHLEEAFLKQDCLFLTFEHAPEDEDDWQEEFIDLADISPAQIQSSFGNIHPLEGLRSVLYEEEALTVLIALEALNRFIRDRRRELLQAFPSLTRRYRIPLPSHQHEQTITVNVSTIPELAAELEEISGLDATLADVASTPIGGLRYDLIPEDSFVSLGVVSWEKVEELRKSVLHYFPSENINPSGEGLPVILVQTSRPKAIAVVDAITAAGGLKGICFNPGADLLDGDRYDLGLLQTANQELYLFAEFLETDPVHIAARKKWDERCKHTKGLCGLIIARGLMGASRGQPQPSDMMAFFETRSLSPKKLGIGTLQLVPQLE